MFKIAREMLKDALVDGQYMKDNYLFHIDKFYWSLYYLPKDLKQIKEAYSRMLKRLKKVAIVLRIVEIVLFPIAVLFWQKIILLLIDISSKKSLEVRLWT